MIDVEDFFDGGKEMNRYEWLAKETASLDAARVYHVLVGKHSATTLYYAYENEISHLFNITPQLEKSTWLKICYRFQENHEQENVLPDWIAHALRYRKGYIPRINHQFRRLSLRLLFQVASYLKNGNANYQPITHHLMVQRLVKQFLQARQRNGELNTELSAWIYSELMKCFAQWQDQRLVTMLCLTMTGESVRGVTTEQLTQTFQVPEEFGEWLIEALWDYLQTTIAQLPEHTVLYRFLRGMDRAFPKWNQSVNKTYHQVLKGKNVESIASERHLKPSTISDHFVELLLNDHHILKKQVTPYLEQFSIDVAHMPPSTYADYRETYDTLPFWIYRYWQVAYREGERIDD